MEQIPAFVSVVFMITTFVTVGIFLSVVRTAANRSTFGKTAFFLIPFRLIFQFVLGSSGFYQNATCPPPRLFVFGVAPALVLIILSFVFTRRSFVSALPIAILTIVHIIRIPVDLTLSRLFQAHVVPEIMTFHGTNFDILSGVTARSLSILH
jgi:hypothetical protein